jgi:AcrR family transcriptional regulator
MVRPRKVSDERILEVARDCFLEQGPGVATSVIASRLGISQPALFKRFGTKNELLLSSLMPKGDGPPWLYLFESPPDDRPVREQLVEKAILVSGWFSQMIPCFSTLRASGIDLREVLGKFDVPPPVRGQRAIAGWLAQLVEQGRIRRCDVSATALVFMGAMHSRAFLHHVAGEQFGVGDDGDWAESLIGVLWTGLEPEAAR